MADRMCETLKNMKAAAVQFKANDCSSLMVVKDQVVKMEFQKLALRLHPSPSSSAVNMNAYNRGVEAGAQIKFNPALSQRAIKSTGMLL